MDYELFKKLGLQTHCTSQQFDSRIYELLAYVRGFEAFLDVYRPSFSSEVRKRRPEWLKIESDAVTGVPSENGEK